MFNTMAISPSAQFEKQVQKQVIKLVTVLLFWFISSACTLNNSSQSQQALQSLLNDKHFSKASKQKIETTEDIFALNHELIAFVEQTTAPYKTDGDKLSALIRGIFDNANLSLNYSHVANTTAIQTFAKGEANCLSLTIMAYAMTAHLGFESRFQEVLIPELWTRQNGNTLINKHVNLVVLPKVSFRNTVMKVRPYVIDFDPQQSKRRSKVEVLSKAKIVSYFHVNKAADYMISGQADAAYAYLKAAILADKRNEGAWLNLGVLYSRQHMLELAEQAYEQALNISPNFDSASENLAHLYEKTGREDRAKLLLTRIEQRRLNNPYHHRKKGAKSMYEGDYQAAIKHFKKAISLNAKTHDFYFDLAKAYIAIGDTTNAQRALENAKKRVKKDVGLERRYASKIALLASR